MAVGEHVLVIGGTRGTGLEIIRRLLRDGYQVRALARSPSAACAVLPEAVEVAPGDVRVAETLPPAVRGADHLIFTAGVTKRPSGERPIRETNYDGIRNTLAAAAQGGLSGRFLYMTTIGVNRRSLLAAILNTAKRRTLHWRRLAEPLIRASGLPYTIIRAGVLTDHPPGSRPIEIGQRELPLRFRYRVARADVAEVFVRALRHPRTPGTTFEVVWRRAGEAESVDAQLDRLQPDGSAGAADRLG